MSRRVLVFTLPGLVVASIVQAATPVKHSGKIIAEDPARHMITIEEMGPWSGPGKGLSIRSFTLAPTTKIALAMRAPKGAPDGWPGSFKEVPLTASDLRLGDFATVTTAQQERHPIALSVEVIRPDAVSSPAGSRPASGPLHPGAAKRDASRSSGAS